MSNVILKGRFESLKKFAFARSDGNLRTVWVAMGSNKRVIVR